MKDRKLLYVMNHYSKDSATHFTHVLPLLNQIADDGTAVRLLIEKCEGEPEGLRPTIEVIALPQGASKLQRFLGVARVARASAGEGYSAVFVRIASWAALAAVVGTRRSRAQVFYWLSGTTIEFDRAQPRSLEKLKWWFSSRLPYILTARYTDYFVTGPEPMLDYYAKVGGVSVKKLRLLYNDIQVSRFKPDPETSSRLRPAVRRRLGVAEDTGIILLVHRLSPVRRSLMYLPLALDILRDADALDGWTLVVVGDGADLPELKRQCREHDLSDHVVFTGQVAGREISELYIAADIFIQPSYAEGFPRVLLEAMASGLPIVTTSAGGSATVLGSMQQEYVTPVDDPGAFGTALAKMVKSPAARRALAQENEKEVARYSTEAVARMYSELLFSERN